MDTEKEVIFRTLLSLEDCHINQLNKLEELKYDLDSLEGVKLGEFLSEFHIRRYANPFDGPFVTDRVFLSWLKEMPLDESLAFLEPVHLWILAFSCIYKKKLHILVPKNNNTAYMAFQFSNDNYTKAYYRKKHLTRFLIVNSGFWVLPKENSHE